MEISSLATDAAMLANSAEPMVSVGKISGVPAQASAGVSPDAIDVSLTEQPSYVRHVVVHDDEMQNFEHDEAVTVVQSLSLLSGS